MAFELTGLEYDSTRQQNKLIRTQKSQLETSDTGKRGFQYQPAPYNLSFTLSIIVKECYRRNSNSRTDTSILPTRIYSINENG